MDAKYKPDELEEHEKIFKREGIFSSDGSRNRSEGGSATGGSYSSLPEGRVGRGVASTSQATPLEDGVGSSQLPSPPSREPQLPQSSFLAQRTFIVTKLIQGIAEYDPKIFSHQASLDWIDKAISIFELYGLGLDVSGVGVAITLLGFRMKEGTTAPDWARSLIGRITTLEEIRDSFISTFCSASAAIEAINDLNKIRFDPKVERIEEYIQRFQVLVRTAEGGISDEGLNRYKQQFLKGLGPEAERIFLTSASGRSMRALFPIIRETWSNASDTLKKEIMLARDTSSTAEKKRVSFTEDTKSPSLVVRKGVVAGLSSSDLDIDENPSASLDDFKSILSSEINKISDSMSQLIEDKMIAYLGNSQSGSRPDGGGSSHPYNRNSGSCRNSNNSSHGNNNSRSHSGDGGHGGAGYHKNDSQRNKKQLRCWNCNGLGHRADQCRRVPPYLPQGQPQQWPMGQGGGGPFGTAPSVWNQGMAAQSASLGGAFPSPYNNFFPFYSFPFPSTFPSYPGSNNPTGGTNSPAALPAPPRSPSRNNNSNQNIHHQQSGNRSTNTPSHLNGQGTPY